LIVASIDRDVADINGVIWVGLYQQLEEHLYAIAEGNILR
jgi:hypothetical protein